MKRRMVIVTIDTLLEILKDYLGPQRVPGDSKPTRLLVKPSEQGRFCIEFESDELAEGLPALQVNYENRRVYGL